LKIDFWTRPVARQRSKSLKSSLNTKPMLIGPFPRPKMHKMRKTNALGRISGMLLGRVCQK